MSASTAVPLAQAITDAINATTWSQTLTARREHVADPWTTEQLEAAGLSVIVAPSARQIDLLNRKSNVFSVSIDVAVAKKLPAEWTNAHVDPLSDLVEEFQASLPRAYTMADGQPAGLQATTNDPHLSAKHLREMGVFFSIITFQFVRPLT